MEDHIPEEEKQRRLLIVQEKQRAIQIRRNAELIGEMQEVLVEGRNQALGQWIGRTSQNNDAELHASPDRGRTTLLGQVPAGARDARRPELAGRRELSAVV